MVQSVVGSVVVAINYMSIEYFFVTLQVDNLTVQRADQSMLSGANWSFNKGIGNPTNQLTLTAHCPV